MAYDKADALMCCRLVEMLYRIIDKWEDEGKPSEKRFDYDPPFVPGFSSVGPLVWASARHWIHGHGPKSKYRWETVRSPMIILAVSTDGRIFVAVRGTSINPEWAENTHFIPVRRKVGPISGMVHSGFYDIYKSCWKKVNLSVGKIAAEHTGLIDGLIVTGHSLGAAIASLLPLSLLMSEFFTSGSIPDIQTYLIAPPMVATKAFADKFDALSRLDVMNLQNREDLVPKVPFEALGFAPVGKKMEFSKDWGNPVKNHTMPIYREAIEEGWGDLGIQ